jgi:4-amino-4-deoxy-L-arabinose transferase-like glycosyltransferase
LRRALEFLTQPRNYPWLAVAIASLILLPCLGSHGFWEPREIGVADSASRWLKERSDTGGASGAARGEGGGKVERAGAVAPRDEGDGKPERGADEEPEPPAPEAGKRRSKTVGAGAAGEPGVSSEPGIAAEPGAPAEPAVSAEPGAPEPRGRSARTTRPREGGQSARGAEPRFTERLVAYGIEHLGFGEAGARAPLALLGLLAVMTAFLIGARVAGPRAGFIAAMVLLSFPLLVLQSRQLTSEIAAVTGSALVVLGLIGLALPSPRSAGGVGWLPGVVLACDVAAIALGGLLAALAAGPLLGLVPPLGGVGLGALVWCAAERGRGGGDERRARLRVAAIGGLALLAGLAALAWFAVDTFSIADAAEGDRQLFGRTLRAGRENAAGLGGPWKIKGDPQMPFSAIFEQIAFGLFPWVALAPLAVVRLASGRAPDAAAPAARAPETAARAPWAAYALFAWVVLAWVVATIAVRKVGPVQYPAIVAIAVAIALWIDELIAARAAGPGDEDGVHASIPLLALFGLMAAVVVGKDLVSSPAELTALTAPGVKFPEAARVHWWIAPIAALFGGSLAAGLFLWRGPYALRWRRRERDLLAGVGRWGLHAAIVIGVVFAGFLAYAWIPELAGRMSSRDVLEIYRQRRQEGDKLAILGNLGTGPSYYAGGDYVKLGGRSELLAFLARPERVFALTRASELCPLHKDAAKRGLEYHVLDDRNVQFLLVSNRLPAGEVDQNPLARAIRRTPPDDIQKKLQVNFDDQIELIGVNMPQRVGRGDRFEMTLFYKVQKPVSRPWKIFVHVNAPGAPANINGDHAPIRGRCSMSYFQAGDYIVDSFEVKAGDMTFPRTSYRVFTGFFVGGSGNYTNMKALSGDPDENNRVPIGSIQVR